MKIALLLFAVSLLTPSTAAEDRHIERILVLDAPIEDVWDAWTTDEGVRTFFGESSRIELRPGGPYEILFDLSAPEGSRGCEGCRVLAFDRPHMLSFTWNAPPKFNELRNHQTHVTIRLRSLGPERTELRFVHEGFGESDGWKQIHGYFENAWGNFVLPSLQKRFTR